MNKLLRYIILFICVIQHINAQEDGVVAFELPIRNSLKFNQYTLNPTFSFVREQNKYISFTNKRQWVQFDDAPQTYLFSYSGRFRENIGGGIGLFQQDYGVLTTYGGILNFAYNAALNRDSNLTFGMNIGFYTSGINEGRVITNFSDPSLDNIPSNSILTVNPGINYGTAFFDFGLSVNNAVAYNFTTSAMIEDNPEQAIQAHVMYTGYMNTRGFFDESKFSTLIRSEFKNDETVLSGIAMLVVPKGIWAQAGYNTKFGFSGGIGLNITKEIALEYNYEQAIGDLSNFGNSHEITLAYKLKNKYRFNYGDDDDEQALITPSRKSRRTVAKNNANRNLVRKKRVPRVKKEPTIVPVEEPEIAEVEKVEEKTEEERIEEQRLAAIEIEVKRKEEARLKAEAEAMAQKEEEERKKAEQAEKERLAREAKLKEDRARIAREAKLKAEAEAKAKLEAQRIKAEQEAKARLEEDRRLKEAAEAQARAEEEARLAEESRLKAEAEAEAKLAEEERLRKEEEERIKTQELDGVLVPVAKNRESREMNGLIELSNKSRLEQQNLLNELNQRVASNQQDLDDLKEEKDLSEQGIYKEKPKVFKSISAENRAIESLKVNLDNLIKSQELQINELDRLYREVAQKEDSIATIYLDAIMILKKSQEKAKREKQSLVSELLEINKATEIERKRRIKRAKYDNEEDRYRKDRETLNVIKNNTSLSEAPLSRQDFDSGEVLDNIQIVKDVSNTESGYYLVVAVHSDVEKRDEFLRKAVAEGEKNIDFFFDVNTNKYYIYYEKHDYIDAANRALEAKGSKPYNANMSMVKIEN